MTDWERVFRDACDEAGCAYDNEALLQAISNLKRSRGVAQAPGEPEITISVLQMLSPTEDADIDFLLNSLVDPKVDPTFNRGVVAGFRRQLINVAAAEAALLALSSTMRGTLNPPDGAIAGEIEGATSTKYRGDMAVTSTDPRCTCAAIVNPNIPHARSCPLSSTNETGAA